MITGKMKILILIFLLLAVALFLFISNHDYKTDEPKALDGKYCFNKGGPDSIIIFKDHTYKHKHIAVSGIEYENHGKWSWNISEIDFHDFTFYNNEGPSGGNGLWISRVVNSNDEIRLIYSSENGIYYYKKLTTQKIN
jgi:hypothetical protein